MRVLNVDPNHPADKEGRVRKGTVIRAEPRTTGREVRRITTDDRWLPLIGGASGGWKLTSWNLSDPRNVGYIHQDDVREVRAVPFGDPATPDQEVKHTLERYEAAIEYIRSTVADLP